MIDELARITAYRTVLTTDLQQVGDALSAVSKPCNKSFGSAPCITALQNAVDAVHQVQTDIGLHVAPACLASVGTQLRHALSDLDHRLQDTLAAIVQTTNSLVSQGYRDPRG
jgi:hypothetical protein